MTPRELGARWKAYRRTKGMALSYVCDMLGLLPSNLRAVEAGTMAPTLTMMIACAQLYGVSEKDLMG